MSAGERSPGDADPSSGAPREVASARASSSSMRLPPAIVALSPGTIEPARPSGVRAPASTSLSDARSMLATLAEAVRGGLSGFVLREPALGDAAFLALAREARTLLGDGWLAIHDRVHLARACGADAVHVGFRSLTPRGARAISAAHVAIGFSAHAHDLAAVSDASSNEGAGDARKRGASHDGAVSEGVGNDVEISDGGADRGARHDVFDGADYVFAGPVHAVEKAVELAPLGFDGLARLVQRTALPTWAIGGLSSIDVARVRAAGARGVVVRRGILGAGDPRAACAAFLEAWERAS